MARGQRQKADTQLGTTNRIGSEELTSARQKEAQLMPGYTSLMNTGYFNPDEEHAAVTSEMGATAAPFETAKFEAGNRASATRNAADLTAQSDQLAMEQGRAAGDTAANLQREKMQGQLAGAYGIGELEKGDMSAFESMYGLGPGTLNARAAGQSAGQEITGYGNAAANLIGAFKK